MIYNHIKILIGARAWLSFIIFVTSFRTRLKSSLIRLVVSNPFPQGKDNSLPLLKQIHFLNTESSSLPQCTVIITTHRLTELYSHLQNNTKDYRWMKKSFYKRCVVIGLLLWNLKIWQCDSSTQSILWPDKYSVMTQTGKQHLSI